VTRKRKGLGAGLTNAIGGALVEFEQQIFRGRPRVEERFTRRDEVSLAATDGGRLIIGLPNALEGDPAPSAGGPAAPVRGAADHDDSGANDDGPDLGDHAPPA
jgi:hypothetical protein